MITIYLVIKVMHTNRNKSNRTEGFMMKEDSCQPHCSPTLASFSRNKLLTFPLLVFWYTTIALNSMHIYSIP